jgi:hypothetical protein
MSILSGFDVVIELNRSILVDKIRAISIGGSQLDPPTEISLGNTSSGADVIILEPIQVALTVGSNAVTITIPFDDSTIYFQNQAIRPLKGTLTIAGAFEEIVVNATTDLEDIGLVVGGNGVSLQWDTGSYTQNALSVLSASDRSLLEAGIRTLVLSEITSNAPSAQLNFNIDPNRNGLLGTAGLRFRSVTVQNIDANTIGIFGVALLATQAPPSILRTEPGLPNASFAAVSLSPATFQQLVFCPGAASSLMSKFDPKTETADQYASLVASNMPPVCGGGQYVPLPKALKLVDIQTTLQTGSILLTGTAVRGLAGDAYCFRVDAAFNTNLFASVTNGTISLTPNPAIPNVSATLDVSWYCFLLYFLAALLASPITAAITIVLLGVAEILTAVIAPLLVNQPLSLTQTEQVGLANFTLESVTVVPERLTLLGIVPSPPAPVQPGPSVTLQITNEQPGNVMETGKGTYNFPGSLVCKAKQYPYTESTDEDVITLSATPHLMGTAPIFTWIVAGVTLTATSGTLTVNEPATIPQPGDLPGKDSESLGVQTTTVDYKLTDALTLVLTGHGSFNYAVNVEVQCQTLTGFVASDNLFAVFTNSVITMGGTYYQDMATCAKATRIVIGRLSTLPERVPVSGDPGYREVVQILRQAIIENKTGAADALIAAGRIYGSQIFSDIQQVSGGAG